MNRQDKIIETVLAEPKLLAAIAVVATVLLSGMFILKPVLTEKKMLTKKSVQEVQRKDAAQMVLTQQTTLKKKSERFMDAESNATLIQTINQIAQQSGMTLSSVTPIEAEKQDTTIQYSLLIESDCTFHELGRFISKIESYEKFLKIGEMNVTNDKDRAPGQMGENFKPHVFIRVNAYRILTELQ